MTSLNNIGNNASSSPSVAGVGGSSRHIASGKFDNVDGQVSFLTLTRRYGAPIITSTSLDNGSNSSDDNYMENGYNNGYDAQYDDDPDSKPSSPQSQDNNNLYDGYEEEAITFPQSTHSWLFTESIYSLPFTFAIGIVSLSYISLILALLNIFEDGEPGNRFNVPVSCSTTVRIAQYIAMIIALVMEEEIPTGKWI